MIRLFDYRVLAAFILFVCTVVILYDFDKLESEGGVSQKYVRNVAGMVDTKEIFYSKDKYKNILDRNVFENKKNTVFTPVKKPKEMVVSKTLPFSVNGIFTSPHESIVMISEIQGNKTHFITVGETVNEWVLESVDKSKVVFTGNNGEKNIFELNVESEKN